MQMVFLKTATVMRVGEPHQQDRRKHHILMQPELMPL